MLIKLIISIITEGQKKTIVQIILNIKIMLKNRIISKMINTYVYHVRLHISVYNLIYVKLKHSMIIYFKYILMIKKKIRTNSTK